jgi:flagellar hook-associated protein 2
MTISSAGIGSGLDVNSLVTQLVQADRAGTDSQLSTRETTTKSTISALGSFKSVLAALQSAANALTASGSGLGAMNATSSEEDLFTASATSSAVAGSFRVEVLQTATAAKIASTPYTNADTAVGTGTVTLHVGATDTFSISLTAGDTLAKLRDKINAATDNKGVTATILNEAGGSRLILTSKDTGVAKAVTLTSDDGSGASFITTSVVDTAKDAHVKIDDFDYYSGSNTISGAITGVTLNLKKAEIGTVGTLSLGLDGAASVTSLGAFVKAYNAFISTTAALTKFDAANKTAAPLLGDSTVRTTQGQIRSILGGSVTGGSFAVLSQIGITTQTDGTLALDSSKLNAALASDSDGVRALLGGTGGFATKLDTLLDGVLDTDDGSLAAKSKSLQGRLDDIADQRSELNLRMAAVEKRYRAQFTALDTMMGQMQTTSSYLAQQLANLPRPY